MDRLVVTGGGTIPFQMTLGFVLYPAGLGKLSSLGISTDGSFFSPLISALKNTSAGEHKTSKLGKEFGCKCSHPEAASVTLVQLQEIRRKKSSKREGKVVHILPSAVCNSSNTVTCEEVQIDLAKAAATLEHAFRESSTAVLESAYEKPAFERYILELTQSFISRESKADAREQLRVPLERDIQSMNDSSKAFGPDFISEESESLTRDPNKLSPPNIPSVTGARDRKRYATRLNLLSRITKQKIRLENINKPTRPNAKTGQRRLITGKSDIWSEEADRLIKKYGNSPDLLAVKWGQLPHGLLTSQEEIWLSNLFKPFMQLQALFLDLRKHLDREPLDEEWSKAAKMDLKILRRHIQIGQAARNKIIQHNLRLVAHQARKYYRVELSLSLFDLCQEGVQGLFRAIEKFNPKKGARFSTYAVYWIRNGILRSQTRLGHIIRAPYNVAAHRMNIKNTSIDLTMKYERAPTPKEIMQHVGMGEKRYNNIMKTTAKVGSLHERSRITGKEHIEGICDPDDAETQLLKSKTGAMLRFGMDDVLDSLQMKENLVIRQRYGLDGKGDRSFGEIGNNLNLSREMVRKYEIRGILKLRHPHRLKYLRGFIL